MNIKIPRIGQHFRLTKRLQFHVGTDWKNQTLRTIFGLPLHGRHSYWGYYHGQVDYAKKLANKRVPEWTQLYQMDPRLEWNTVSALKKVHPKACTWRCRWKRAFREAAIHIHNTTQNRSPIVAFPRGTILRLEKLTLRKNCPEHDYIELRSVVPRSRKKGSPVPVTFVVRLDEFNENFYGESVEAVD